MKLGWGPLRCGGPIAAERISEDHLDENGNACVWMICFKLVLFARGMLGMGPA